MTSKLTRERLQEIAEDGFLKHGESKELARMALVAMDSEPVKRVNADQMHHVCLEANRHLDKYGAMAKEVNKLLGRIPAQPAPVVPEKATVGEMPFLGTSEGAYVRGWNDCRAAILQESQKSAGESNNCRSCENVQDLQAGNSPAQGGSRCSIKAAPALDSSPKTAESRCGNSPVILDGLSVAAPTGIPMISNRWIPVSERMPARKDGSVFLTWNGQYIGKELFLMGSFQCLKPEIITHWMPLPAAPQEVKGE